MHREFVCMTISRLHYIGPFICSIYYTCIFPIGPNSTHSILGQVSFIYVFQSICICSFFSLIRPLPIIQTAIFSHIKHKFIPLAFFWFIILVFILLYCLLLSPLSVHCPRIFRLKTLFSEFIRYFPLFSIFEASFIFCRCLKCISGVFQVSG